MRTLSNEQTSPFLERSLRTLMVGSMGAMLLIACEKGPSPAELAMKAENERLSHDLQSRDSLIGDMTHSFDEIEANIELMEDREQMIAKNSSEQQLSLNKKEKIVRDLQLMNGLMKESRDRIKELTARLDRSKIDAKGLRAKLKELDLQLAQRDSAITNMKGDLLARDFRIDQINKNLDSITMVVAKREAVIDQQTAELNKAYYVMGTEEELEAKGVLTKEGGFIGIGKHTALNGEASTSTFTQTDVRDLHRIPVRSKKAELMSEHPANSYEMVKEDDMIAYLEIKDADAFWKLSKYAVLEVK
jgi:hypothetical protein